MRALTMALVLALGSGSASSAPMLFTQQFEWPAPQADALLNVRLTEVIRSAEETAREAETTARNGNAAAAHAERRAALRHLVGKSEHPIIIAAGTVISGSPEDGENGPILGTVNYPNDATMTGAFGPDIGVFKRPGALIANFSGWVYGATSANPAPLRGVFTFRNGESFTGEAKASFPEGIYSSADGERLFIGIINLDNASFRPVRGVMTDRHGRLLAVVNGRS